MVDSVEEFLQKKGAIELLSEFSTFDDEIRYSTFEELVPVSVSTFDMRRQEALELGLIEVVGKQRGSAGGHAYALTDKGSQVRDLLDRYGVRQAYQVYRVRKEEYDEKVDHLLTEIMEE